jgi:hypothetical protein
LRRDLEVFFFGTAMTVNSLDGKRRPEQGPPNASGIQ